MNLEIVSGKDIPGKVEDAAKQTRSPSTPSIKITNRPPRGHVARPVPTPTQAPPRFPKMVRQQPAQTQKPSMSFPVFIGDYHLHFMQPPTPKIGHETLDTNFPDCSAQRFVAAVHGDRARPFNGSRGPPSGRAGLQTRLVAHPTILPARAEPPCSFLLSCSLQRRTHTHRKRKALPCRAAPVIDSDCSRAR